MRLLADACAGQKLARQLSGAGHDIVFVGDWDRDPGDEEILALAQAECRAVVTRDKDFGTLAVRDKMPSFGIVRLVGLSPAQEAAFCLQVLATHETELGRGTLITVEPHRVRLREPE